MKINLLNGTVDLVNQHYPDSEIHILFAGDVCPRYRTERVILEGRLNKIIEPSASAFFDKDISIVNLETPLTNSGKGIIKTGPVIKVDPYCVNFLKAAKIDVCNLANNHIGDYGPESVLETIELLKQNDIEFVGAGSDLQDARKPLLLFKNGLRVAVLSYAENEFGGAEKNKPGSSTLCPIQNINQVREVSSQADITIVLIHGGNEYNPVPSPRMAELYREFANAGASAVIGSHTHCPQGIEIFKGVPIIYSLGNLLFDNGKLFDNRTASSQAISLYEDKSWWTSFMIRLSFNKDGASSLEVIPFTFGPDASEIRLLKDKERDGFLQHLNYISGIIEENEELKLFWYAWCEINGPKWLKYLEGCVKPVNPKDEAPYREIIAARNAFTCEAHNELITTYLRMLCENRIGKVEEYITKIFKMQNGEI